MNQGGSIWKLIKAELLIKVSVSISMRIKMGPTEDRTVIVRPTPKLEDKVSLLLNMAVRPWLLLNRVRQLSVDHSSVVKPS